MRLHLQLVTTCLAMLCLSEAKHFRTVISDSADSTCLPCTLAGKPALQEKALERFLSNLSEEARLALSICDVLCGCDWKMGFGWIWNNKLHTLNIPQLCLECPPLEGPDRGV